MDKKRSILEVDKTIISRNLQVKDIDEESLDFLFPEDEKSKMPSKVVVPIAGFCMKTVSGGPSRKKAFINVCHTEDIPAPPDISLQNLMSVWDNPENANNFLVPISFAAPRVERDKQGVPCDVYDVAINTSFFTKIESEVYFRTFLLQVIFEGIANKHGVHLSISNGTILKNRKVMGTIQPQRIQVRSPLTSPNLVEAVDTLEVPVYVLGLMGKNLVARFHTPNVSEKDVRLQLGEDRIRVEAVPKYRVDMFVPFFMDSDRAVAVFDCQTDILHVTIPISSSNA